MNTSGTQWVGLQHICVLTRKLLDKLWNYNLTRSTFQPWKALHCVATCNILFWEKKRIWTHVFLSDVYLRFCNFTRFVVQNDWQFEMLPLNSFLRSYIKFSLTIRGLYSIWTCVYFSLWLMLTDNINDSPLENYKDCLSRMPASNYNKGNGFCM